mgnify:CR=1 FL=1|jgi:hypothetical protein
MWFVKQYVGALLGTMFGATVATLTTMALYGDLPPIGIGIDDTEAIMKCLADGTSSDS